MSIIDTFDDKSNAIISPSDIAKRGKNVPEVAVAAFSDRAIEVLESEYSPEIIGKLNAGGVIPIYAIDFGGSLVAVYRTVVGASSTVALMEEMHARGCKKFVFFGSCGVLNSELAPDALIVPTAAYRDEGTSYHYAPPGDYIEIKTAARLSQIFMELNLPHKSGKTWTTDAIYRETRNNMEKRRDEGCITVEMECSAIMAASAFRGFDAYQFLYAADNLDGVQWDARTHGTVPKGSLAQWLRVALEVAARI